MSDNKATQEANSVLDRIYDSLDVREQTSAELREELNKSQAESDRLYQILHGIWEAYQPSITFENWLEIAANHPEELLTLQNDSPSDSE